MNTEYGLYVILTKPLLPHAKIAEICVKHGIRMLQLREKDMDDRQLLRLATTLRSITRGTSTSLVINDRPDIAVLCEADYLHLGQDDIPMEEAKKIIGERIKIGLSTHSIEQAKEAIKKNPDYIGFGPVYATNAKAKPDPPVGTHLLKEITGFSSVPVVAIGGIFPENIHEILNAGAKNIAMVRYLMQTTDFENRLKHILSLMNQ